MHPAFPVMAAVFIFLGKADVFVCSVLALLIHEAGHLLISNGLGLRLTVLEMTPMGGVLKMDEENLTPLQEGATALAGPAASLIAALILYAIEKPEWERFYQANLLLFGGNMLPVLPLDGGRALRAVLSEKWNPASVSRALSGAGCALGGGIILLGIWGAFQRILNPMLFLLGAYMIYAALRERETLAQACISALHDRQKKLENGGTLPVKWMAARQETPNAVLASKITSGAYCAFILVDEQMKKQRVLEEGELLISLLNGDSGQKKKLP